MSLGLLILGLVLIVGLIVIHEFGHFVSARRNGVDVEEFGIFFPPALWKRKMKGKWYFSINLIPLGGFVRLKGERDEDKTPGGFGAASLGVKVKIMLAGITMNLLAAFILLTVLGWIGMPQLVDNQYEVKSDAKVIKNEVLVGYVEPHSPAAAIHLSVSDEIVGVGLPGHELHKITTASTMSQITKLFAGKRVAIEYVHNKQLKTAYTTLQSQSVVEASQKTSNPKGYLGVSPSQYTLKRYTWSAPVTAVGTMVQFTGLTFKGLGTAVVGLLQGNTSKASGQVTGPVGIFVLLKNGSLLGYQFILMIVAVISLSLAIMNVLPIPALDGGKVFVTILARLFRKTISEKIETLIYGISFLALILLGVLITIVDVHRFL